MDYANRLSGPLARDLASGGLSQRQIEKRDDGDYFWYTKEGYIVKYILFLTFIFVLLLWIVGGRAHARRRMRKGLRPMAYHSWLLSRSERGTYDPRYAQYTYPNQQHPVYYRPAYGQTPGGQNEYGMYNMPPPPPVYDASRPPMYMESDGSKIDPAQAGRNRDTPAASGGVNNGAGQSAASSSREDYAPPAGPPPPKVEDEVDYEAHRR
ncbi:hypothetical protein F5Y18DRAFT_145077 [Xylariaceae sp. FL1019]|nr:hypothetical protein F5Y18DRAFT_145077 [Xylariaceae sp. FL1019]